MSTYTSCWKKKKKEKQRKTKQKEYKKVKKPHPSKYATILHITEEATHKTNSDQ